MPLRRFSFCTTLLALAMAPVVRAETMISAHAGVVFGGDHAASVFGGELDDSAATYGGALTFVGGGPFGFEIEGGYTPDFFGGDTLGFENNLGSLMGHLLLGTTFAGERVRIFASAGAGVMKSRFDASELNEVLDIERTDFGVSGGVGAMGFLTDNLGIRGDARYFRSISDHEAEEAFDFDDFSFWCGTAGLVLRF